jgi:hypothetical protein
LTWSIAALKVDGKLNVAVKYEPLELLRFLSSDFGPMNVRCERAEMIVRGHVKPQRPP